MMKKAFFLFVCLDIISFSEDISFDKLKNSALIHSSRLNVRFIDTKIEEARLRSIYSIFYPQLNIGYTGEYNKNLNGASMETISVGDMTINSAIPYEHSVALRLNYELFRFGATLKQIEAAEKEIEIKKLEQCNEEAKLYRELLEHYVRAQRAQSEQSSKSRMRLLRQELYTLKQRLHAAGQESRVSVGDEAIRLIDLERDIERARMEFEENIVSLSKLSYVDLNISDIQLLPLAQQGEPESMPFSQTPQSHVYEEKIFQKNAEIKMLQRNQFPIISLYSSYYLYGSDTHNIYDGFRDIRANSWNAGVSLRWNLFEGFKYNGEAERLRLELERIQEEAALAEREFEYETRIKQERLNRLATLTKNETKALEEARGKLLMTQRLRAQGEADAVSEVSVALEAMERELTLETETIMHAYEAESLKLQHMGVESCILR